MSASLARRIQRITEDELGQKPALGTCQSIVDKDGPTVHRDGDGLEELAVRLFELRRTELLASAKKRKEMYPGRK